MKKLTIIATILFFGGANAQKIGATAGFAVLNARVTVPGYYDQADMYVPSYDASDSQAGGYIGMFGEFGLANNFKFQPGINLIFAKDSKALQIPLMFKYYVQSSFNIGVGPQLTFDLGNVPTEFKNYYNRTNIGAAFGLGYDFKNNLGIEARYGVHLNDHIKGLAKDGGASAKLNVINLGLNYKF